MRDEPVTLSAPDGARAIVYSLGAQVGSWLPAGGREQLFTAANAPVATHAFKGGVPVCFPQFGNGPLPPHGFARDQRWKPAGQGIASGNAWAAFELTDAGDVAGRWPHEFVLSLRVRVGGPRLEIVMTVENPGPRAWYFSGALHTYFLVDDVREVTLAGLGGRQYLDKTRANDLTVQAEPLLVVSEETDRVYVDAHGPLRLRRGDGSGLSIESAGFPDVVVWNPWEGAEQRWPQFGAGDYLRMLCVEAAVVGKPVSLEKGQRWTGSQILTVL